MKLKKKDKIKNFLELDDIIIDDILNNKNKNKEFNDETIYIIQYPGGKLSTSFGRIKGIDENKKFILFINVVLWKVHQVLLY